MNIRFEGLTLQNFKSFVGKHVFVLDQGPALIYIAGQNALDPDLGANGVGKSTLLDALTWVLYGRTGRDNRPGSSVEPWGEKAPATKVSLRLTVQGKGLLLARSRNPNSLTVRYDDQATVTVTQDEIDRILGLTEAMFRCSVVLAQAASLFLDLRAEAQSQMFTDALQLDQWLDAAKRANEQKKTFAAKLENLKLVQAKTGGRLAEVKAQMREERLAAKDFDRDLLERVTDKKHLLQRMVEDLRALPDADAIITQHVANLEVMTKARLNVEVQYQTALNTMNTLQKAMTMQRKALRAAEPVCPECGQTVNVKHLEDKIEALDRDFRRTVADKDLLHKELARQDDLVQNKRAAINAQQRTLNERLALDSAIKVQKGGLEELARSKNLHRQKAEALKKTFDDLAASLDATQDDIDDQTKQLGMAEYWAGAFKEIRLELIDTVLAELELAATQHAEALGLSGWRIGFATERESKSGVSASFQVLLYPDGQDEAIRFEAYSGGESQRLQLAISFALSEIVLARAGVTVNLEALDEPTRGLSPEGVEQLLEHLQQRAQDLQRTCFVIEHHSLERGAFKKTLLIRKTAKGSHLIEV